MKIVKNGNLTFAFRTFLSFLGGGGVILSLVFIEDRAWKYFFIFLGFFVGCIGSYSAQAAILKLKPFTNDPYGWRKAKKSYKVAEGTGKVKNDKSKSPH